MEDRFEEYVKEWYNTAVENTTYDQRTYTSNMEYTIFYKMKQTSRYYSSIKRSQTKKEREIHKTISLHIARNLALTRNEGVGPTLSPTKGIRKPSQKKRR